MTGSIQVKHPHTLCPPQSNCVPPRLNWPGFWKLPTSYGWKKSEEIQPKISSSRMDHNRAEPWGRPGSHLPRLLPRLFWVHHERGVLGALDTLTCQLWLSEKV